MAREDCKILDTGDAFPSLDFNLVGGGVFKAPEDFGAVWNVLLFYRGHW